MSNSRRTRSGCWTCRLRRKKCDEQGLPCSNCSTRGVFCHGYGLKPSWKDRGEQEKGEASRLQIQSRARRRSRSDATVCITDDTEPRPATVPALLPETSLSTQQPTSNSTHSDVATATPVDDHSEFGLLHSPSLLRDISWTMDLNSMWADSSTLEAASELQLSSPIVPDLSATERQNHGCASLTALCYPLPPDSDSGKRAAELVMHFLGETFPLQHRLCRGSPLINRSWLLNLLMRSPTFCSASLSMSALHYLNTSATGNEARAVAFQDYHEHRASALRGLKDLQDPAGMTSVSMYESDLSEPLICGVQVALLEVRRPYLGLRGCSLSSVNLGSK